MRSRCRCSMCPAIHITSRSWLRSSSTREPSDPPLRVVRVCEQRRFANVTSAFRTTTVCQKRRKKNSTPGRRARGSSFFKPSQTVGRKAVRPQLTPSRSAQRETDRPVRDRYPDAPQPGRASPSPESGAPDETRTRSQRGNDRGRTLGVARPSVRPTTTTGGQEATRRSAAPIGCSGRPETARCPCTLLRGNRRLRVKRRTTSTNSVMILPQVHLRKPCYDFYFL